MVEWRMQNIIEKSLAENDFYRLKVIFGDHLKYKTTK